MLALLHKLFVALLELAHLFRFSRVLLHPLVKLVLVDDIAESEGLPHRDDIADQIVVAQAARVVIEPEKQHQRHQVEHHELHAGHLRTCLGGLRVADLRGDENRYGHQQREQADVVAVERDVERKMQNAVVRRQVVGPEERFAAQLDRGREETEHRDQDRELDQQREAPAHRIDAGALVKRHHRLLLFHRVLLLRVFLVDLVHLGFQ